MEVNISTIIPWPINFAPKGWMFCQGQQLQVRSYQALFSLIGNRFGGDGINNFNLPDLRGRIPMSCNATSSDLGQVTGAPSVTLTTQNVPSHAHMVGSVTTTGLPTQFKSANPTTTGAVPIPTASTTLCNTGLNQIYSTGAANTQIAGLTVNDAFSVASTGAGAPISLMPPYLVLNYIIAVIGYYPQRP